LGAGYGCEKERLKMAEIAEMLFGSGFEKNKKFL